MIHLHEVVVHRLRDADAGEIVAGGAGALGQPMRRVGRVVAADIEEVACTKRLERRQRPIEVVVYELVPARAQDAGRRDGESVQETWRLRAEIDEVAGEQPFDAVAEADNLSNRLAGSERGADDPEERAVDDGGWPAGLADDEGLVCRDCQRSVPSAWL
jgi:hypothetical protein